MLLILDEAIALDDVTRQLLGLGPTESGPARPSLEPPSIMPPSKVPDIIDNAYVIVEFDNGSRGKLDLRMIAEGSKNEQEISVVGDVRKGEAFIPESFVQFGTREAGRDGVRTLKAEDHRIKYDGTHHGSSYLEHLNFLIRCIGGSEG